jgi:putative transposase
MSMLKLEVSIPEIRKTLETFSANRIKAFDRFGSDIREAVGIALNQLLNAEMALFLGDASQSDNKRNGYYNKNYTLKGIGTLKLRIPIDRKRSFSSAIIPHHERIDPRLKADMAMLHLAGVSTRMLAMISRRLLGVEVSKGTVTASLQAIHGEARQWLNRPIDRPFWALYVDGTNFKVQRRGSTEREPSLIVLGVDNNNRRSILAIEPGTRDNVEAWRSVFRTLKQRGLKPAEVRLGIMDGLPGLEALFKEEFSQAQTARCWFHAMSNALAKAPARLRDSFKVLADKVMYAGSEDEARVAFSQLKEVMMQDGERAIHCLEKDLDSLLVHYRFDMPILKAYLVI